MTRLTNGRVSSERMPKPGFYPDPSKRYVYRFWSGTEWAARVNNFGDEYVDAVQQSFPAPDENLTAAAPGDSASSLVQRTSAARAIAIPVGSPANVCAHCTVNHPGVLQSRWLRF